MLVFSNSGHSYGPRAPFSGPEVGSPPDRAQRPPGGRTSLGQRSINYTGTVTPMNLSLSRMSSPAAALPTPPSSGSKDPARQKAARRTFPSARQAPLQPLIKLIPLSAKNCKYSSAHIFSNASPVAHRLLPLLFRFSDTLVRIQLRSTCQLYRRAYYTHSRSILTTDDVLIYPLQFDVVLVRDWHVGFSSKGALRERSWSALILQPTFRSATELELSCPLIDTASFASYSFGRLPSIPLSAWSDQTYMSSRTSKAYHGRCSLVRISGVPHSTFGYVSCERWLAAHALSYFTVRDVARICSSAYVPWHHRLANHGSSSTRHAPSLDLHYRGLAHEIMKGVLAIRVDTARQGYVFDPLDMPGHTYS
jgi:hypothetical protein